MRMLLPPFLGWCPPAALAARGYCVACAGTPSPQKEHHVTSAEPTVGVPLPLVPDLKCLLFSHQLLPLAKPDQKPVRNSGE